MKTSETKLDTKLCLRYQIGVNVGGVGTGIGGAFMHAFMTSPFLVLCGDSVPPTTDELALLRCALEWLVRSYYNETYQKRLLDEMLVPADEGTNTIHVGKGAEVWHPNGPDGWCWRRATWERGPMFLPSRETTKPEPAPWTLDKVLSCGVFGRYGTDEGKPSEKWEAFKAANLERCKIPLTDEEIEKRTKTTSR